MKIAEIVAAFERNKPEAPEMITAYMSEMELEAEELSPDIHRLPIWDVIELLFYYYGPKKNWTPRPIVEQWLDRQPGRETDQAVILDAIIRKANQPQEIQPYDFYIPTQHIRRLTYKAFETLKRQYPDYIPDVNPVVREQFLNDTV